MTTYFDDRERNASECLSPSLATAVADVKEIEDKVIADVFRIVDDHEFPDDLRSEILVVIARWQVGTAEGKQQFETMQASRLLMELHSLFHEVASRRIKTRFGMLSDSPSQCLLLMDEWEFTAKKFFTVGVFAAFVVFQGVLFATS